MMQEITLETKIADLLSNYDGMKDILIGINPKFKKLNNPVLRRTLGKIAGVKQAAIVGGMDPYELLNQLRVAVGQEALTTIRSDETIQQDEVSRPSWIDKTPVVTLNANEILERDENPLAAAHQHLKKLQDNDIIAIVSDFRPEPLLDEFSKNGKVVYCEEENDTRFVTYIKNL